MTESYELPVLFTDDECKAYAAWGMKKEKVLMPFALITILIYMVATVLVVMKVWVCGRVTICCSRCCCGVTGFRN